MVSFGFQGGQGDDALAMVDSMIDGRPMGGGSKKPKSATEKAQPSLLQALVDGVKDLLGGGAKDRKNRDNTIIRGDGTHSPTVNLQDGPTRPPNSMLIDDLWDSLGGR